MPRRTRDDLKRLNGSIARHETEMEALKLRAASTDSMCPLVEVLCSKSMEFKWRF